MIAPMLSNGTPDINNNFVLQANGNNIWTNKNITTTGSFTMNDGAIIPTYVATASTVPEEWTKYAIYAATKFKKSDPDLTMKNFVFIGAGGNTYTLKYYKIGNVVQLIKDGISQQGYDPTWQAPILTP